MSSIYLNSAFRAIVLTLLQVIIFKSIDLSWANMNYISLIVYPLVIILFPLSFSRVMVILLAFALGFVVDVFYDSIGVHASACVFIAYLRPYILQALEPFQGYQMNLAPSLSNLGWAWFLSYSSIMMILFLLFYFSMEAFSIVYYSRILISSILSFICSMFFIMLHQIIFNTKE